MEQGLDYRERALCRMINELANKVGIDERKYIHLNTVNNLISHFTSIPTEHDKVWIHESLTDFIRQCEANLGSIDKNLSNSLFEKYLKKVTFYYSDNLGFSFLLNRTIFTLIYITLFVLLLIIFNLQVSLFVIGIYLFHSLYVLKKYREKKVYSIFY